jgi:hypothetical protein
MHTIESYATREERLRGIEPTHPTIGDGSYGTEDCHELLARSLEPNYQGITPLQNADSIAWMAAWAYGIGMGTGADMIVQKATPPKCPEMFRPGVVAGENPPTLVIRWARFRYRMLCIYRKKKCFSASEQARLIAVDEGRAIARI